MRSSLQDRNKRSSLSLFLRVAFSPVLRAYAGEDWERGGRNDDEKEEQRNDRRERESARARLAFGLCSGRSNSAGH